MYHLRRSDGARATVTDLATGNTQPVGTQEHAHDHAHTHAHAHGTTISLEQEVLPKNNQLAE